MAAPQDTITALTLNCWGLKYISKLRAERIPEIGRRIAGLAETADLSIVGLQECWVYADFLAIHALTQHVLPHAKFFHSGVWGSGLAVLSRWPVVETSMYTYPLCGRPTAFWRGDWFVGKGIASATIRVNATTEVEVLVTHTHAPYESRLPNDSYLVHQLSETWEMGKRARAAAERGRLVLSMGDFNMTPDSLVYNSLRLGAGAGLGAGVLHDTWRELHPDSSLGPADHPLEMSRNRPVPTAVYNLQENGTTSDNVYNTWRWTKDKQQRLHKAYAQHQSQSRAQANKESAAASLQEFMVDPETPDPRGKRLDYIFYASPKTSTWRTASAQVVMLEPHPTVGCTVSDHLPYMVTLACVSPEQGINKSKDVLPNAASIYDRFIHEYEKYMLRELNQRYWRGVHFFASVAVAIGCYVAVWFSPRPFVAFLLTLLASLGLAAGVVDGLISLLFFGSEIRSLKEFCWEITNAKSLLASQLAPTVSPLIPDKSAGSL